MELTKDKRADGAHLCPGHQRGSTRKLVLLLLVFFLWLLLPFSVYYPTAPLSEQQEEPWGVVCLYTGVSACTCMCVCV